MRRGPKPTKSKGAKPPVARKSPKTDAARVIRDLEEDLAEAREQQTATAEILRVIGSSPTDVQPVFDKIALNAVRVCDAAFCAVFREDGGLVHLVAHHNFTDGGLAEIQRLFPMSLQAPQTAARLIASGKAVHVADVLTDERIPSGQRRVAEVQGYRGFLGIPMLRDGKAIGAIAVARREVGLFSESQVELLQTFADQAVIAIENVRLFRELEARNRDLAANSEILQVIASSPTDTQPVFDAIARSAAQLCEGLNTYVILFDGERPSPVAYHNVSPEALAVIQRVFPKSATRSSTWGRALLDRAVVHIPDVTTDPEYGFIDVARADDYRSTVAAPMLRDGIPIGAITVARRSPFSEKQIALVKTFADQAVIAIENVRLFTELQEKNQALTQAHAQVTESLDQQTATSEILRVIASSPTDVQPVFDSIAASALRLCDARLCTVFRFDGELIHLVALQQVSTEGATAYRNAYPARPGRGGGTHRAILTGSIVHIPDIRDDPEYELQDLARANRFGCVLSVPMFRDGHPIGAITVGREAAESFSDAQIELLKTFADQAVIAIENVRLFNETKEALDQQTATSEVLRVIASSPTDVQPVFDAIAESAARLCDAYDAVIWRLEGDGLRPVAHHGPVGSLGDRVVPMHRGTVTGRTVLDRQTVHVTDLQAEVDEFPEGSAFARQFGHRSIVSVPLLREGVAIGVMSLRRAEVQPFTEKQIDLLKTFADQAVIAIENVRLFTELQASNRELTTALDTQTATSDILRVISRSPTDVQPVFDAIVESAVRLLRGYTSTLARIADGQIALVALTTSDPGADAALRARYPQPLDSDEGYGQTIRGRTPLNIGDAHTDPRLPDAQRASARLRGFRSLALVPLLRQGDAIGAIGVSRREPGGFADDEIALLQTFADQAVIAVENARLLSELQARTADLTRSVGELRALGEVGRALSSTLDLETVLNTIVARASQLAGTDACSVYEYDEATGEFYWRATANLDEEVESVARRTPIPRGVGAQGRMAVTHAPVQIPDIAAEDAYQGPLRDVLLRTGTRAVLAVPLLQGDRLVGGLTVNRKTPGEFSPETVELLKTFATQSALAINNARLFREIEEKRRQLEVASRHKSEFLANMSHELRTPLNAVIGFSEVLNERMFGDLNEKQDEYLKDIHASGQHLLSLINDILDLSKIEAGRMELELTDFDLPTAIENALMLVRERAGRRSIALHTNIDNRLGQIQADERKVRQVVLNLLSNAIKFTPEGGSIQVGAVPKDGLVEVSVSDTGVGIAPEDQEAVFEEFRQVGTADKKVEGTGLGLALSRRFIELHGGKIWVKSEVGKGSTFTFTVPVRRGE